MQNAERRTLNAKRRAQDAERRAQDAERLSRTLGVEIKADRENQSLMQ